MLRTMVGPTAMLLLCGCLTYASEVSVMASADSPQAWTAEEMTRAVEVVWKCVPPLGFEADPNLAERRRLSEKGQEYEYLVLAAFLRGHQFGSSEWITVSALMYKDDSRFVVLIRDFNWMKATPLTIAVEESIADAMRAEFPARTVEIRRETVGPALAP